MHPAIYNSHVDDDGNFEVLGHVAFPNPSAELLAEIATMPVMAVLDITRAARGLCFSVLDREMGFDVEDITSAVPALLKLAKEGRRQCASLRTRAPERAHVARCVHLAGYELAAGVTLLATLSNLTRQAHQRDLKRALALGLFSSFMRAVDEAEAWLVGFEAALSHAAADGPNAAEHRQQS